MDILSFFDFSHTRISWNKPLNHYSKIRTLYCVLIRNRPLQVKKIDLNKKKYLNLGCGPNIKSDFINLDCEWIPGIDLCWDLRKEIPLPDESVDGAYASHCVEHIPLEDFKRLLTNLKRIIKKTGVLRIVVPDVELYIDIYTKNKLGIKTLFCFQQIEDVLTPMMYLNRIFRDFGHQYAYDEETLLKLLTEAGYTSVKRVSYMQGNDQKLLIDLEWRATESLYIEATV